MPIASRWWCWLGVYDAGRCGRHRHVVPAAGRLLGVQRAVPQPRLALWGAAPAVAPASRRHGEPAWPLRQCPPAPGQAPISSAPPWRVPHSPVSRPSQVYDVAPPPLACLNNDLVYQIEGSLLLTCINCIGTMLK